MSRIKELSPKKIKFAKIKKVEKAEETEEVEPEMKVGKKPGRIPLPVDDAEVAQPTEDKPSDEENPENEDGELGAEELGLDDDEVDPFGDKYEQ